MELALHPLRLAASPVSHSLPIGTAQELDTGINVFRIALLVYHLISLADALAAVPKTESLMPNAFD